MHTVYLQDGCSTLRNVNLKITWWPQNPASYHEKDKHCIAEGIQTPFYFFFTIYDIKFTKQINIKQHFRGCLHEPGLPG